ncbi:protein of unknown function [Methylococcus capsulatus]|uniref:Uncharacterized protein n=1 Tax=Methylococcus capsulatus TaxID=414 RepID=A0AA35XU05_METCP|nr:protein of unknown function [Methylococcus capsulatus]
MESGDYDREGTLPSQGREGQVPPAGYKGTLISGEPLL